MPINQKTLAIIPARGGSKRIINKNIKNFCGQPIINYSIQAALQSGCFDEVMVSTDSEKIAAVAKQAGAKVPFMRSSATSDDHAVLSEVILEVIQQYAAQNQSFSQVCCILPTAPFLTAAILQKGLVLLEEKNAHSVFPVMQFHYPIQRGLKIVDDQLKMCWPENEKTRSQDLEPVYHDAGQFYWVNAEHFLKTKSLFSQKAYPLIISALKAHDIDSEEDWRLAEIKFQYGDPI